MTSVATIMGAAPVAYGFGAGSAARKPLGYAIVGGVFFSTALTLFVVPVAYLVIPVVIHWIASAGTVVSVRIPSPAARPGGGRLMLALLLALQGVVSPAEAPRTRCADHARGSATASRAPRSELRLGARPGGQRRMGAAQRVFRLRAALHHARDDCDAQQPAVLQLGTLRPEKTQCSHRSRRRTISSRAARSSPSCRGRSGAGVRAGRASSVSGS